MDSFIDEFFEEWMDSIINDIPLVPDSLRYDNGNPIVQNRRTIQENVISNMYRLRRTLEIQNQVSEVQNSMFHNIYELLTDNFIPETELEDVKIVLGKQQFDMLNHFKIDNTNNHIYSQQQCNICMENYSDNENLTKLYCNHTFHKDCIENWLCNEHVTCPICRTDIRNDSEFKNKKC